MQGPNYIIKSSVRFSLLFLGLSFAVSCASDRLSDTEIPKEISLRAGVHTKADPELAGSSLGTDNSYVIHASASTVTVSSYFTGLLYTWVPAPVSAWAASEASAAEPPVYTHSPVYWPLGGEKVDFLALATRRAAGLDVYAELAPVWDAVPANGVTISDWDTYARQYDVMYAAANDLNSASNAGKADLQFNHSMAVLGFKVVSDLPSVYTINSLTVKDLEYKGTLTVDNSRTGLSASWSALEKGDKALHRADNPASEALDFAVGTEPEQCAMHLLVPQQPSKSITITYTMPHAVTPLTYTITLPRAVWKAGNVYEYTLRFRGNEIIASPSVTDWNGGLIMP